MAYRILLLSAYDAMSHRLWRGSLQAMFEDHQWTQLHLPARHFNWRIRGNSLQWALGNRDCLTQDYDLLIATSMVDLASLRGFVPELASLPTILYFHENQFVYPRGKKQRSENIEPQLVPLYAAFCADAIVFNSEYNRTTFIEGAANLLERLPERLPAELMQRLRNSELLPVPLEAPIPEAQTPTKQNVLEVVWNHRWEYDKGPRLLLQLADQLLRHRLPIRLHIVGQQFRGAPQEFERLRPILAQHAAELDLEPGRFGFIEDRDDYTALLRRCDVVLSTADHDFQGLAVQEACLLGCTPLAPNRLVYPEYLESPFLYNAEGEDCMDLLAHLRCWQALISMGQPLPKTSLTHYTQQALRPRYAALFERLLTAGKE